MAKGEQLKGALRREPRQQLTRVSPGVYRNQSGRLVSQQGRPMGRRGGDGRDAGANQQMPDLMYRYPPGQAPNWDQIGETFGVAPGQIQDGLGRTGGANPVQWTNVPMRDQPGPTPEMVNRFREGANKLFIETGSNNLPPQNFEQQYQPSANQGGRFRLSPGVYGTREQAMRQFQKQRPIPYNAAQGAPVEMQRGPMTNPNTPVGQMRQEYQEGREMYDTWRENNLTSGNPIKRPENVSRNVGRRIGRKMGW